MRKILPVLLVLISTVVFQSTAIARLYIRIAGIPGTVIGSSTTDPLNNYIEIQSTGIANGICTNTSGTCAPPPPEFVFNVGRNGLTALPRLQERMLTGTLTDRVDVAFTTLNSRGEEIVYYQIRMSIAKITSIAEVGSDIDGPDHQYKLTFDEIAWKSTPILNNGNLSNSPVIYCWNYRTNRGNACNTSFYF